jgi:enoyl-CoA hydratase/carnithine racemase
VEICLKPVIAAVHGGCIGGGVDLVAAADIRVASACAYFAVAEAQLGLAADLGTLQRLPTIMGSDSLAREMALTARRVAADEALRAGLLSAVLVDAQALLAHAHALAARIAALSPVAVQGTKLCMNFSRGRPAGDGLAFTAAHNAAMLQTSDIAAAAGAAFGGKAAASFPPL